MAVGTVTKYNGFEKNIEADAQRQWDDSISGNIMFCLVDAAYTPSAAHATTADITGAGGSFQGTQIAATTLAIDNTTTAGTTYYSSDNADFGSSVTITAKYLVAVMPVTNNTFSATTSKLLFYVDLNTASGSATVSSTSSTFIVQKPNYGWLKST